MKSSMNFDVKKIKKINKKIKNNNPILNENKNEKQNNI